MDILNASRDNIHDIEQKVLSMMLNDKKILDEVYTRLEPKDFDNPNNCKLFKAMELLYKENKLIDLYTVVDYIKNNPNLAFNNFDIYIQGIVNKFTTTHDINIHIDIIKNSSITRQLTNFADILKSTKMDITKFDDQMWGLEKSFLEILRSKTSTQMKSSDQVAEEYIQKLKYIKENKGKMTGTSSGYKCIDAITNGFQPGDLIILAARPSIGKTALSLNFLLNACKNLNEDEVVVMFSLEMGAEQLFQRLVSCKTGIDSSKLRDGSWDSEDEFVIYEGIHQIAKIPLLIDDASDLSILDIQTKLKQIKTNKKVKLVIVDYLQLLKGSRNLNNINRQQEVAQISRTLKAIARDIETPIIAVAQLSRKIEERKGEDKKPMLSDLRESGAIEQDADLVTFINYDRTTIDEEKKDAHNPSHQAGTTKYSQNVVVDFTIAKHRNGATGELRLLFDKSVGKYMEID